MPPLRTHLLPHAHSSIKKEGGNKEFFELFCGMIKKTKKKDKMKQTKDNNNRKKKS